MVIFHSYVCLPEGNLRLTKKMQFSHDQNHHFVHFCRYKPIPNGRFMAGCPYEQKDICMVIGGHILRTIGNIPL